MVISYDRIVQSPRAVYTLTGLGDHTLKAVVADVVPCYQSAETTRRTDKRRQRAIGGGPEFTLSPADQVLLTLVRQHLYLTYEELGSLFGVSTATALRVVLRITPLLAVCSRLPTNLHGNRRSRQRLAQVLRTTPELRQLMQNGG